MPSGLRDVHGVFYGDGCDMQLLGPSSHKAREGFSCLSDLPLTCVHAGGVYK